MTPSDQSYREIPLTLGQSAKVSPEDYERIAAVSWHAHKDPKSKGFYARRCWREAGKLRLEIMARVICGIGAGDKRRVDHINHDTLDNRRSNLRVCTHLENCQNRGAYSNNSSGFLGVSFHKHTGKYAARIRVNGKLMHLGLRQTPEEAHELYREAAKANFGQFSFSGLE